MNKAFKTMFMAIALIVCLAATASAEAVNDSINWSTGIIRVTGMGVSNPNIAVSGQHARALSKRAAMSDAYRLLAEVINGVQVTSDTTVQNMMISSDTIKTHVQALIQGAKIVDVTYHGSESCEVTMEMNMFGSDSLAQAILPKNTVQEQFPAPSFAVGNTTLPRTTPPAGTNVPRVNAPSGPVYSPATPQVQRPAAVTNGYTGVIIDCRELGLNPAMSPVIKCEDGTPIYGYKNLNYQYVIKHGMAGYAKDMSMATRAGSRPLIIRAIRTENHGVNPVISAADANLMLMENQGAHFLDNTNVVFLR